MTNRKSDRLSDLDPRIAEILDYEDVEHPVDSIIELCLANSDTMEITWGTTSRSNYTDETFRLISKGKANTITEYIKEIRHLPTDEIIMSDVYFYRQKMRGLMFRSIYEVQIDKCGLPDWYLEDMEVLALEQMCMRLLIDREMVRSMNNSVIESVATDKYRRDLRKDFTSKFDKSMLEHYKLKVIEGGSGNGN